MSILKALGIFATIAPLSGPPGLAAELRILTHPLAPFTTGPATAPEGLAIDIVQAILARTGDTGTLTVEPFPRLLRDVESGPWTVGFIVARTPERERLMQWVGPIAVSEVYFYQRAGTSPLVTSLDEARRLGRIGVQLGNADAHYLQNLGFTNLDYSDAQVTDIIKLDRGRLDATPVSRLVFSSLAKQAGLPAGDFVRTPFKLYELGIYVALSPDIPKSVVNAWSAALTAMKATGEQTVLLDRYRGE